MKNDHPCDRCQAKPERVFRCITITQDTMPKTPKSRAAKIMGAEWKGVLCRTCFRTLMAFMERSWSEVK